MNKESPLPYTDRLRDGIHRTEGKKSAPSQVEAEAMKNKIRNPNKDVKLESYDKLNSLPSSTRGTRIDRKTIQHDNGARIIRHSALPLTNDSTHTPRFEVYDNYTLVAKHNQSATVRPSSSNKTRSDQLIQPYQPVITMKPHYGQSISNIIPETIPKIVRTSTINPEQNRSMSAIYKSQTKPEHSVHKSLSHRQQIQSQTGLRSQTRPISATVKHHNSNSNHTIYPNYESLNRTKHKSSFKPVDENSAYYSLPRHPKNPSQNGGKYYGSTKRIQSKTLYIDTSSLRKPKTSPIKLSNNSANITVTDSTEENLINFSQTLARAATNSPPIKRRTSSLLHNPNPRVNARFATKSTIDEIYTQKNRKDNYEKYKKAANEILRENLALKFGENYPFNNHIRANSLHLSSSSLSSTSSATDQQHSISSLPPDDIPLDIPNQHKSAPESFQTDELLFHPQKSTDTIKSDIENNDESTEILDETVTGGCYRPDNEHVSDDDDNEDSDEYELDNEKSSSESFASDSDGDIEQFKKKFVPLHEIERMDNDFDLENNQQELPDHQHSQSFRIENTSIESQAEVFVYKESLQRAKDALTTVPNHSILSIKSTDIPNKKKRRAIFDPHILLLDACLEPDLELVKELVPKISDISRCTIDGITALHNAVCSADAKLVLFLIQSGANVNASDADGWTPLHCAACCNNKQISKILVENGASLFAVTLSDYEIPSQKCSKSNPEDTQCEEYLFWEQENLGVSNGGTVYTLFDYFPQRDDELPLLRNQILKVINTNPPGETGWFLAKDVSEIGGVLKEGFVAAAYVSSYSIVPPKRQ